MIVDDSFNYHSLSLTIMFAIKRSMIVHDSLSKSRNVLASPRAIVNKYGRALNFVTKMAVYQPRGAAIATILVTVMQDDICEELLGRHKRGRTKEWIRRRDEKGMYRCISNYHSTSRCLFFFGDSFRFSHLRAFSVTVVRIFVQIIALLFFTERWQYGCHMDCIEPALVTPRWQKNYRALSSAQSNGKNYHELSCRI